MKGFFVFILVLDSKNHKNAARVKIERYKKKVGDKCMDKKYREENPGESFDGGYHLYAKEKHKERVEKNPDRIAYAIKQFEKHDIEFTLKNNQIGHFHCIRKSDGKLFQFYAGTGKIQGYSKVRGIHTLIKILENKKKKDDL